MDESHLGKLVLSDAVRTDTVTVDLNNLMRAVAAIYPSAPLEILERILLATTRQLGFVPVRL